MKRFYWNQRRHHFNNVAKLAEQGLYASSSDGKPGLQLCEADKGIIAELFEYTANAQKVSAFQVFEEKYREKIARLLKEEVAATDDMVPFGHAGQVLHLRNYAGMISQLKGETFDSIVPGGQVYARRRALGVV